MDIAHLLLLMLFLLTIAHLIALKVCSVSLDHRTAPLFISSWTIIGLIAAIPLYGHLWTSGLATFIEKPWFFALAGLKAGALFALFIISQKLMKVSLSSRHYVTPMAVGMIAVVNSFFGESLTAGQWFSALGLCGLAAAFFFKGHMAEMDRPARIAYFQLVGISVVLSAVDQVVLKGSNWYVLQWVCNLVLLAIALVATGRDKAVLKAAFATRAAAIAGFFYAATELVKFYQMVTINPVSVVVIVQSLTKPVILALSALIWHERTVREQLVWGILALVIALPLLF